MRRISYPHLFTNHSSPLNAVATYMDACGWNYYPAMARFSSFSATTWPGSKTRRIADADVLQTTSRSSKLPGAYRLVDPVDGGRVPPSG